MGMRFLFLVTGWEGSAADATMYNTARMQDFTIPNGKCYLADAGFGICEALLVPYRGVRYHLAEWGRANLRYVNRDSVDENLNLLLRVFIGLRTIKSYTIFDMHLHAIL